MTRIYQKVTYTFQQLPECTDYLLEELAGRYWITSRGIYKKVANSHRNNLFAVPLKIKIKENRKLLIIKKVPEDHLIIMLYPFMSPLGPLNLVRQPL
jgi:hypothetical protein